MTLTENGRNAGWSLVYEGYDPEREPLREALCTLGNGYFATRGAAPDSRDDGTHYPGTYLAGGYNRLVTEIKGREIENEDLVNLPNWLGLTFRIDDGPWFSIDEVEIRSYRQELDVRRGLLIREIAFRDAAGRCTRWLERRMVSMAKPHLAALEVTIVPEDWQGRITIRSAIDGAVINNGVARYRDLRSDHLVTAARDRPDREIVRLMTRTRQSRLEVALAVRTRLYADGAVLDCESHTWQEQDRIGQDLTLEIDQALRVEKVAVLYSDRDRAISEPMIEALTEAREATGFADLLESHEMAWRQLWDAFGIAVETDQDASANLKLRVHCFHLLQTASRHTTDLDIGVPARGWHGEAYRGHIFWDELFIFPFLNLRMPVLTRALLRYRYRRLPAARRAARDAGYSGAMFPWQSGSDGREESQRLHLNPQSGRWIPDNSSRQRHINAAIAYNIWHYYEVTGDIEFLNSYGAEMMLEIARFWASIAQRNPADDRYDIRGVMGPDEFQTAYPDVDPSEAGGIDNNAYTNVMAAWVLNRARDTIEQLGEGRCQRLREQIGLSDAELEHWEEVSRRLRVIFHEDCVISQFEGYADLEEFDWDGYREKYADIQRLDRILEAEGDTVNRYKASKQADVLMLFYLFTSEELALLFEQMGYRFDAEVIRRTIDYYQARTSHGSTLSRVVHSWVLARANRPESWPLFRRSLDSDIQDIQGGTTPEGIHLGAMAGTVDLVQRSLTGLETRDNVLHFNPRLPAPVDRLTVHIRYRGHMLDVEVTKRFLKVASRPSLADPITISYRGHVRRVAPSSVFSFRLVRPFASHGRPEADEDTEED